jgi:hypothetical protein
MGRKGTGLRCNNLAADDFTIQRASAVLQLQMAHRSVMFAVRCRSYSNNSACVPARTKFSRLPAI